MAAGLCLIATLAACGSKNSLTGTWRGDLPAAPGTTAQMTVEFKPDGSLTQTILAAGQTIHLNAGYTARNGQINQTFRDATINGVPTKPKFMASTLNYKVDGDTLTLARPEDPHPLTLHRVAQ
jgi:hypothetical protein